MFDAIPAESSELLSAAFRLRYQVYCIERQFLDPDANPGGFERDGFDAHSSHAVLVQRTTGTVVGTVRLVLPKPGAAGGSLPFYERLPATLNVLPTQGTAEISRLALSRLLQRPGREGLFASPCAARASGAADGDGIASVTLKLMGVALRMANEHGIVRVCAMMEPALLRLFARFEIRFQPIGTLIDYHGWRQPCWAALDELVGHLEVERPDIWSLITDNGRNWRSRRARPAAFRPVAAGALVA